MRLMDRMIYLLYGLILGSTIYIYILTSNPVTTLKIVGIINLISCLLTVFFGIILNIIIKSRIDFINTSKVTGIIFSKFLKNGLVFLTVGLGCYITNYIINYFYRREMAMVKGK